ncbi:MAG: DNA translocase FtsK 4TM domain-containing protein [Tissierellia bacterium]|nr:DNA translocase FtsK 4TM domain-containing protein [Tissierellia bacterium]
MTKKKTRKKKNTNKSKQLNKKFDLKAFCIFLIIISLILFISVISNNTGFLGKILGGFMFKYFGISSYILPLLVILTSISVIRRNNNKISARKYFFIYLLMLNLCIIMSTRFLSKDLTSSIDKTIANLKLSGGFIGTIISFYMNKFIGLVGIVIVSIILAILCLIEISGGNYSLYKDKTRILFIKLYTSLKKLSKQTATKLSNLSKEKNNKNKTNNIEDNSYDIMEENIKEEDKLENLKEEKNIQVPKTDDIKVVEFSANQMHFSDIDKNLKRDFDNYNYPSIELLDDRGHNQKRNNKEISKIAKIIEDTLESFSIQSKVMQVNIGPTVTCFELKPARGIKVSKIVNLADDLALALASSDIRIEAPIPGKPHVGIEVPNKNMEIVGFKELINTDQFVKSKYKLPFILGKSISGSPVVSDISKMPHLLVAGATGSGKSVCINTIIMSLIYKFSPDEVKLLLIDPKMVELSVYNGIPHLIMPVISDPKKASSALYWAVSEMERRYKLFGEYRVRDISSYKKKQQEDESMENLAYEVVIIDELSDLMMVSANEVEDYICRLAQMSRACGIHLIIATQRPTVDVITGTIKANIPSRIAFAVSSQIDSRTILDCSGAEKLLGKGDMLFYPSDYMKPKRIQGSFVSDSEVVRVVNAIKDENSSNYDKIAIEKVEKSVQVQENDDEDELIDKAIEIIISENTASVSLLQRKLKVGYARAGRIIDQLENRGVVGGYEGSKPRKVLVDKSYLQKNKEV